MVGGSSSSSHEQESSVEEEQVIHKGGCHCGRVRWEAKGPKSVVATKCNCSICSMKGNINFSVPASNFKLIHGEAKEEEVEEFITTYTFGTHIAKHTFCKVCGISSFYVPRSDPNCVALTVECVDPGTLTHVEVKDVDGRNWEKWFSENN